MPDDVLSVLGAQLRRARNNQNLSQDRLAEITGLSSRYIAKIEKGEVNPSFEVLSTLKKALSISFDAMLNPPDEQVEADIQEIAELYRRCPEPGRRLILVAIRAVKNELMDMDNKN